MEANLLDHKEKDLGGRQLRFIKILLLLDKLKKILMEISHTGKIVLRGKRRVNITKILLFAHFRGIKFYDKRNRRNLPEVYRRLFSSVIAGHINQGIYPSPFATLLPPLLLP